MSVPKLWKPLREALSREKENANYITIQRFFELCPEGLDKEEHRLSALEYFHLIGIVLHFSSDNNLRDIVFLNPNWITQALYAALDKANQDVDKGVFERKWIFEFWEKHKDNYSYQERSYLLRLMLKDKFDICYEIANDQYIVPMLLPNKQPAFKWDSKDNLGFRIQYPFMPEGIISRFIVRMNEKIDNSLIWLDGVILRCNDLKCRAQVIQKKDFESGLMFIDINISGGTLNNRKEFLVEIRKEIEHIHTTSFVNIPTTELVKCNCEKCIKLPEPHFYSLKELKEYINEKKHRIECRRLKDGVSINQLLGAIYTDKEIKRFIENDMKKNNDTTRTNEPIVNSAAEKRKDTMTALIAFVVLLLAVAGVFAGFHFLGLSLGWVSLLIVFVILAFSSVWTYSVSSSRISENGALKMFDKIFRRLDIVSKIISVFKNIEKD